jgi:hypothetical protein
MALAIAAMTVVAGCSSDDGSDPDGAAAEFTARAPDEITRPTAEGKGIVLPQPAPPLPAGYVQEELFVGGTASSFSPVDTPDDGTWTVQPADEADYRTRVIVRRPAAEQFSGTVLVEWFNVSAIESAPDWAFLSEEIGRQGHVYIGVSTQKQGVEGGETLIDVEADAETAEKFGATVDKSGLKNIDAERYGTLEHPGDGYAYDIFDQVARAARENPAELLGGLEPEQVVAVGESQSAAYLTTLVNAIHPIDPVFDGFLIHSRGAGGAPVEGGFAGNLEDEDVAELYERSVRVRTDLDVPVLLFETETDLTLLGFSHARQPDTDLLRTWEVAGTAHADAHMIRSVVGGPRNPSVGSLLDCTEPINTGPQHEVLQAALHRLVDWVAHGTPAPAGERIELVDGDDELATIARDEHEIALGGVRNPLVDAPVATLTGDPPGGVTLEDLQDAEADDFDVCLLFGGTIPFDRATLVDLYGDADGYLQAFRTSADEAVAAGFLLRADADQLIAEAEAYRALFDEPTAAG